MVHFGSHQIEKVLSDVHRIDQVSVDHLDPNYVYLHHIMHADVKNIALPINFANGIFIFHVLQHMADLVCWNYGEIINGWMLVEVSCTGRDFRPGNRLHKDCTWQ